MAAAQATAAAVMTQEKVEVVGASTAVPAMEVAAATAAVTGSDRGSAGANTTRSTRCWRCNRNGTGQNWTTILSDFVDMCAKCEGISRNESMSQS